MKDLHFAVEGLGLAIVRDGDRLYIPTCDPQDARATATLVNRQLGVEAATAGDEARDVEINEEVL